MTCSRSSKGGPLFTSLGLRVKGEPYVAMKERQPTEARARAQRKEAEEINTLTCTHPLLAPPLASPNQEARVGVGLGLQLSRPGQRCGERTGCGADGESSSSAAQHSCADLLGKEARSADGQLITQSITDSMTFVCSSPCPKFHRGPCGNRSWWIPELRDC